jgi:hypothetical protein
VSSSGHGGVPCLKKARSGLMISDYNRGATK